MTDKVQKIISNLKDVLDDLGVTSPHRLPIIKAIEYLQDEPIIEDLEEAIGEYCSNPENFITYIDVGFKQSPIKKDDIPLIIKAIKFGANWQKEQMMKKAVDVTVHIDNGNYPYIPQMELYDYDKDIPLAKEGDKYSVVLIKKD